MIKKFLHLLIIGSLLALVLEPDSALAGGATTRPIECRQLFGTNDLEPHRQTRYRTMNEKLADTVEVFGNHDSNTTLIFIPGGPGLGYEYFLPFVGNLAAKYQLAFANPGYSLDESSITMNALVEELEDFVQSFEKQGKEVILVAHSGGSTIALESIKTYGFRRSVFVSWIYDMKWIESYCASNPRVQETKDKLKQMNASTSNEVDKLRNRMLAYTNDYFPSSSRSTGITLLEQNSYFPAVTSSIEKYLCTGVSYENVLRDLPKPILSITGPEDQVIYPEYIDKAKSIAGHQLIKEEIPEAGHFPFIDDEDLFSELIINYVETNRER